LTGKQVAVAGKFYVNDSTIIAKILLTNVKIFSDCVSKATLDHPNCLMAAVIPTATSASLDTVLRKSGNNLSLERRGDEDPGDIYKITGILNLKVK